MSIQYPNLNSTIRHNDGSASHDSEFCPQEVSEEPDLIGQRELSDLIKDMNSSKTKSEILPSRLQQQNLLQLGVKVSVY